MKQRLNCQHLLDHRKAREFQKISTSASLTKLKPLTVWITTNCGKFMEIPNHFTCLLRNLYAGQEAILRIGHRTIDLFQLEKKCVEACHPAYLTYINSTSCRMPGWMNHKLESRLPGEIPTTSDMQKIKILLMRVKEESEKAGLNYLQ